MSSHWPDSEIFSFCWAKAPHLTDMHCTTSSIGFEFRSPAEPMPPPVKEPPEPPENPDVPVREPDPDEPAPI